MSQTSLPTILLASLPASFFLTLAISAFPACGSSSGDNDCSGDKCDLAVVDFADRLEGREDPIADFLRTLDVDSQSRVAADFGTFAAGIAELQGCGEASWKSYVISDAIVAGEAFPRVVSTVCSDNPSKASEFFIAASFKDPNEEDIDPRRLEMFAWDAKARIYRFYASEVADDQRIEIELDPERCTGCHLTPSNLASDTMRMTPIMNELTQPWSHWNSEVPMFSESGNPFRSHDFEVPLEVRSADDFLRYAGERVGAAADLEAIIREGHDRVSLSRSRDKRERNDDWRPAMNLMRPLFCEEQLNYATEDFGTGLIRVSALIPGGIREAYKAERSDNWPWEWVNNDGEKVRLAPVGTVEPLDMLPLRGNADVSFESRLLVPATTAVFTPRQILQIRALDWRRPVLSDFRCGIWLDAVERFESVAPTNTAGLRDNETMRELYPQVMQLGGVAIASASAEQFIALPVASDKVVASLQQALAGGEIDTSCASSAYCSLTMDQFGDELNSYVAGLGSADGDAVRNQLREERDSRLCRLSQTFQAAPGLPAFSCDDEPTTNGSYTGTSTTAADIPDNDPQGVTSRLEASASGELVVQTLQVRVQVEHTWRGDLRIDLTSPAGETAVVHAFDSSDSDDGFDQNFSVPDFSGDTGLGAWTLTVVDGAGQDTGRLLGWSIGINADAP
jgi:subtilisin-like proprotein convertase family protein